MSAYDPQNIFAKILRGEIPCQKLHESAHSLAFRDIRPLAPAHILVVPKGAYVSFDDFAAKASAAEIEDFWRTAGIVARQAELVEGGYRIISNHGANAHQEVPHFHIHILGGRALGPMLVKP
jgi:histidine triad (HIT) family protein